nr:uncharacterized protein LOC133621451 [Nerophis lumbriciformis]
MDSKEPSLKSRSYTSRSTKSSAGNAAALARANAEAAKARLNFAEKDMILAMEKAQLEAQMMKLSLERDAAVAEAEAKALEAALSMDGSVRSSRKLPLQEIPCDPLGRTREYVTEQSKEHSSLALEEYAQDGARERGTQSNAPLHPFIQDSVGQLHTHSTPALHPHPHFPSQNESSHLCLDPAPRNYHHAPQSIAVDRPAASNITQTAASRVTVNQPQPSMTTPLPFKNTQGYHNPQGSSNNGFQYPAMSSNTPHNAHHDRSGMSDVIRYFARRELVTTCMTQFNDQLESYSAWQQSFQNAVRGLHLTCSEEMDLLVKWLGKESGEHAKRIRAVNTSQPQRGLQMIWDRLDACYGAPEVVEEALFQRISNFPKITYKDYAKLHELSDLLMELQAAKTDGTLPGLHYLDTARGISPLVHKLPSSLQEKWLSVGSDYK